MLDYTLQSLYENRAVDLNKFKGKRVLITFFDSNCKWCEKQMQSFEMLLQGEQEIEIIAVAMGKDIDRLKMKMSGVSFPVLKASEYLLTSIGGVKMTPYTLVANKFGNFETKIVGYKSEDQIESIIHKLEGK